MQNSNYFTLVISHLTPIQVDVVTAIVFDAGACGTEESLLFEQKNRVYEPVTLEKERTDLTVYFNDAPSVILLERLRALFTDAQIAVKENVIQDWMAEWKKGFLPFDLAGGYWVVPSWCKSPQGEEHTINIDPGMAFGTGTHETTKLAAGFIVDYVNRSNINSNSPTMLDVGTGTGILAILAERVGFKNIVGNDIDSEARRVVRENLLLNQTKCVNIVDEELQQIPGEFDWVVANIIDGVLVQLQTDLKNKTKHHGFLLLTGILLERDDLFRKEFVFADFKVIERRVLGEWVGYFLQKMS